MRVLGRRFVKIGLVGECQEGGAAAVGAARYQAFG